MLRIIFVLTALFSFAASAQTIRISGVIGGVPISITTENGGLMNVGKTSPLTDAACFPGRNLFYAKIFQMRIWDKVIPERYQYTLPTYSCWH